MAKLTKTDTKALAVDLANRNARVSGVTVAELESMNYDQRMAAANAIADEGLAKWGEGLSEKYLSEFRPAYYDAIQSNWQGKMRNRTNARNSWKRATTGMSVAEAEALVKATLADMRIRGAEISNGCVTVGRTGRNDDARLYYSFERDFGLNDRRINPDDDTQSAGTYRFEVKISTTGSSFSPAEMSILHKIHGELIDAANELTVRMARENIIWTYGIPEAPAGLENLK
jgi:hypothetical protein